MSSPVVNDAMFEVVVRVLSLCQGKGRSMTLQQIGDDCARYLELPANPDGRRRLVERTIEEHLDKMPWPIVSGDEGVWIPDDPADLDRYVESLKRRCMKMFIRRRVTIRKAKLAGFARTTAGFSKSVPRPGELF